MESGDYDDKCILAMDDIFAELMSASSKFPPMASPHEGYAIILEELDELKEELFKQHHSRNPIALRKEAMQVGAIALRFMVDCCGDTFGREVE